jgi:hypothetical protein
VLFAEFRSSAQPATQMFCDRLSRCCGVSTHMRGFDGGASTITLTCCALLNVPVMVLRANTVSV